MLFNGTGKLILIRNTYGQSDLFVLPGGGIKPFEQPSQAALREVREELGYEAQKLAFISLHTSAAEGKRDTIYLFEALVEGEPAADPIEVLHARFFPLDELPPTTSPATRRRIEEYLEIRQADGTW